MTIDRWEYMEANAELKERNELGAQGWELVAVDSQTVMVNGRLQTQRLFHFKRRRIVDAYPVTI